MSQKISESYLIQNPRFLYISLNQQGSKPTNRLTDIREIQIYLEISLYLSYISKEVSQLAELQTYKTFRIIRNFYTSISGISKENFRKIYLPELEISLYLSNFSKRVSQQTE